MISEKKMQIVIDNYFKSECNVDTSIRDAFEKGFRIGVQKTADRPKGEWILVKGSNGKDYHKCSKCLHTQEITGVKNYCAVCGAIMKGGDDE